MLHLLIAFFLQIQKGAGGFNAGYDYVAPEESGNYEEIVEDTKPENKTDKKQIKKEKPQPFCFANWLGRFITASVS